MTAVLLLIGNFYRTLAHMRFTTEQLTFLARFNKSPEGLQLVAILNAKLAEANAGLRVSKGEEVYRQQGRALQLDELLEDIAEAPTRLARTQPARQAGFGGVLR